MDRSGLESVDLVKIDVEGHEQVVLTSLAPMIARYRPRVIVFEHDGDLTCPTSPIRRLMEELDYEVLRVEKGLLRWRLKPVAQPLLAGRRAHDYVAVPVESVATG